MQSQNHILLQLSQTNGGVFAPSALELHSEEFYFSLFCFCLPHILRLADTCFQLGGLSAFHQEAAGSTTACTCFSVKMKDSVRNELPVLNSGSCCVV